MKSFQINKIQKKFKKLKINYCLFFINFEFFFPTISLPSFKTNQHLFLCSFLLSHSYSPYICRQFLASLPLPLSMLLPFPFSSAPKSSSLSVYFSVGLSRKELWNIPNSWEYFWNSIAEKHECGNGVSQKSLKFK